MLKLFYDTAPLDNFPCGVAVYTCNILAQLAKNPSLDIHTGTKRVSFSGHRRLKNFIRQNVSDKIKYHPIYFPGRSNLWGAGALCFKSEKYDIVHFTAHIMPSYVPFDKLDNAVLSVHDMFLWHNEYGKQLNESEKRHVEILPRQAEQARAVLTFSEFSKKEIIKFANVAPDKIYVIPEAAQWNCPERTADKTVMTPFGLESGKYFLAVSSLDPHKNYLSLLTAFDKYRKSRVYAGEKLVIVGGRRAGDDAVYDKITSISAVVHLTNITEDVLHQLYLNSAGAFQLSYIEGFGIPLLEAMSCRIPSCYARGSSMDEIGRDAAFSVEPDDIDSISDMFAVFSAGGAEVDARVQMAYDISQEYSWQKSAAKTFELYCQLSGK